MHLRQTSSTTADSLNRSPSYKSGQTTTGIGAVLLLAATVVVVGKTHMIKRKPDVFSILAVVVAIGIIASVVITEAPPADADGLATGFVATPAQGPHLGAR